MCVCVYVCMRVYVYMYVCMCYVCMCVCVYVNPWHPKPVLQLSGDLRSCKQSSLLLRHGLVAGTSSRPSDLVLQQDQKFYGSPRAHVQIRVRIYGDKSVLCPKLLTIASANLRTLLVISRGVRQACQQSTRSEPRHVSS